MTAREQAEQLRTQAIDLLLAERALIDEQLSTLGHAAATNPEARTAARRSCGKCGEHGHTSRKCPRAEVTPPSA